MYKLDFLSVDGFKDNVGDLISNICEKVADRAGVEFEDFYASPDLDSCVLCRFNIRTKKALQDKADETIASFSKELERNKAIKTGRAMVGVILVPSVMSFDVTIAIPFKKE